MRLFTRTCPSCFRYWCMVSHELSASEPTYMFHIWHFHKLTSTSLIMPTCKSYVLNDSVWCFFLSKLLNEIFRECRYAQRYLKYAEMLQYVWWFLSGYRAILAEPKNKSPESFEHEYYSNNARQEPRGNVFPFCKSQFFILKIICNCNWGQFGRRQSKGSRVLQLVN